MTGLKPLGITQKFLFFFFTTAIFPIVVFSLVFLHFVDVKFNERIDSVLRASKVVARDIIQGEMSAAQLSSRQIASVSLHQAYRTYLKTGDDTEIVNLMQRYQHSRNLAFIRLVDANGRVITMLQDPNRPVNIPNLNHSAESALTGKTVADMELYFDRNRQPGLMYLAAAPINADKPGMVPLGAIIIGESIDFDSAFKPLARILPDYFLRVYVRLPSKYMLIYNNIPSAHNVLPAQLLERFHRAERMQHYIPDSVLDNRPIYEVLDKKAYKSRVMMLQNNSGKPIGFIVIGTPTEDYQAIRLSSIISIMFCIVVALGMVSLAGWWFIRTIVNPIQDLTEASKAIAQGDLDVRVHGHLLKGEIGETLDNFNEMLDKLQENHNLRQTFVSTLAHDLRTPMIAEAKMLEVLEEELNEKNEPTLASMVNSMHRNNRKLMEMINKLLEAYQYEAGHIRLIVQPFDLNTLITECLDDTRPLAESKQIHLTADIPLNLPKLKGDTHYLKRVFINLLSNAVENIPKGSQVEIKAVENDEGITITVQDNGTGINKEDLPFLFERYYTGNKIKRKIGSGLGLFICKMIVELHDGTIDAENLADRGSRFRIHLPKAVEKDEAHYLEREIIRKL